MTDDSARWHQWQEEHSHALASLQEHQREYHRTIAARALATSAEGGPDWVLLEARSLAALDEARAHLDEVRRRQPMGSTP